MMLTDPKLSETGGQKLPHHRLVLTGLCSLNESGLDGAGFSLCS